MNDLRKAAEMALDALEADREHITYESAVYSAALALRQALAQPEEISDYHEGWEEGFKAGLAKAQPEQEPVAWIRSGDDQLSLVKVEDDGYMVWKPLYTAPPSKPWVSLTDEEIDYIYKQNHNQYGEDITGEYERELGAKLKEKNNG